jgi:hypothetical protein
MYPGRGGSRAFFATLHPSPMGLKGDLRAPPQPYTTTQLASWPGLSRRLEHQDPICW